MVRPSADRFAGVGRLITRRLPVLKNPNLTGDALASVAVSGLIATSAMTVVLVAAYALAASLGTPAPEAPVISRWIWALAHNPLTERAQALLPLAVSAHFLSGLAWALVYARVEPNLKGSGPRRGMVFSLAPWVVSVVVFLPLMGGGVLGFRFGAGPLPMFGNLVVHLVYGLVLGQVYSPWGRRLLTEKREPGYSEEQRLVAHEEVVLAVGIAVGLIGGGFLAGVASALGIIDSSITTATLVGAVGGSLAGAFLASFLGFSKSDS